VPSAAAVHGAVTAAADSATTAAINAPVMRRRMSATEDWFDFEGGEFIVCGLPEFWRALMR
jgi:hypothetical protein